MNSLDPALADRLRASWAVLGDHQIRPLDSGEYRNEKARARWLIDVMGMLFLVGLAEFGWALWRTVHAGFELTGGPAIEALLAFALMVTVAIGRRTGRRHFNRLAWAHAEPEEAARWHAHPRSQQHWLDCMAAPLALMEGDRQVLEMLTGAVGPATVSPSEVAPDLNVATSSNTPS